MTNVLVCIKRVPDSSGEVLLTEDAQAVDGRHVGFTISDHENCAVEQAIQIASATGGEVCVLTVGPAEAAEQLRSALALGCHAATHVIAESAGLGPADVAREIAAVVEAHEAAGRRHDLILLGNDAADSGDFQVGIRLSYLLDRPVVTGIGVIEVDGDNITATSDGPAAQEVFELPLPAVVTFLEGGVEPRYPTVSGRMKAKKIEIEERQPTAAAAGPKRIKLKVPPPVPSQVRILGEGPAAADAVVDLFAELGVTR